MTYSDHLGDQYTDLGAQTLAPKNTFQVFFFQLYFNKKYVEVAINDFTIHLTILKWLRIQKYRQKRKTMRQRGWSERNYLQRCFHLFKYIILFKYFFFYMNSLHWFMWFFLYYLLHLLNSDRLAALTSL